MTSIHSPVDVFIIIGQLLNHTLAMGLCQFIKPNTITGTTEGKMFSSLHCLPQWQSLLFIKRRFLM